MWWLCVGRGGLFSIMTWNRIGGLVPRRVLILGSLLHMLRRFDPPPPTHPPPPPPPPPTHPPTHPHPPPIFRSVGSLYRFDPNIWAKMSIMHFDPCLSNFAKCIVSTPFWPFVAIWVNGRCWASVSETQARTPPSIRLCRGSRWIYSWHSKVSVSVRKRVRGQK